VVVNCLEQIPSSKSRLFVPLVFSLCGKMAALGEIAQFLQSINIKDNYTNALNNGGYDSAEALKLASVEDLVQAGIKPGHAKLVVEKIKAYEPIDQPGVAPVEELKVVEVADYSLPKNVAVYVSGSGTDEVNGIYRRDVDYDGKPMWTHVVNGMQIWFRDFGAQSQWRIGKTNDYYYIARHQFGVFPPFEGWFTAVDFNQELHGGIEASALHYNVSSQTPTLSFVQVSDPSDDSIISITGAGSSYFNCAMERNGIWDEKPMWSNKSRGYDLWHRFVDNHHEWRIGSSGNIAYAAEGDLKLPPGGGWERNQEYNNRLWQVNDYGSNVYLPAPSIQFFSRITASRNGKILVYGAGAAIVNGVYERNGFWDGRPMWSNKSTGFDLWFRIWGDAKHAEWRIGRSNDYYYIIGVNDNLEHPPTDGWLTAVARYEKMGVDPGGESRRGVQAPNPKLVFLP
jgi:hypothetical protein